MGREPLHDLTEQKEKAILVLLPEPREEWQEEDLYQELAEDVYKRQPLLRPVLP